MKNIYKPKLDNTSEGYKAIIKILPNKIEKNSVYGTIKQPYFWLSEKAKRQAEIKGIKEVVSNLFGRIDL